ncbi:MAG: SNF2-related protein [Gammaproteobacteria bacterium]
MNFRDYQLKIIDQGCDVINIRKFLYLAMEVRTGKTLTSLGIAEKLVRVNNVLFITKKKAISSIESDYKMLSPSYDLTVINYESLHKIPENGWDMIICDEAHTLGAFPKPSKRAKQVKSLVFKNNCFVVLLSGTPTPESYSQMYHQVYGIPGNPFSEFKNFYRFCDSNVTVTQKLINGFNIKDYSNGRPSIMNSMNRFMISYTQVQAGFESSIEEEILRVPMSRETMDLCKRLKRDLVVEINDDDVILADTGVKLMSKLHQLYSGTVKFESGKSSVLDTSKADFIKWKFNGNKIGIFYKFKAELDALKQVFGDDICTDLETFDSTDKHIALQIVSGREGISLRNAEYIVFYNIDFSATSYWQARDRMTTKDRKYNKVYWLFSLGGIEPKIYRAVIQKKDYTLKHFRRDVQTTEFRPGRL